MKALNLYQYTCPLCSYTLYSTSDQEELNCKNKACQFKDPLHIKNYIETTVKQDSSIYIVKESFMVDHGCCEVRPIVSGTEVEVVKIKHGWGFCETRDGFSFHIPLERLKRKSK